MIFPTCLFKGGKPWSEASFGCCFDISYDSMHREIFSSILFQMCYWKCYYIHNFEIDAFFLGGGGIPNMMYILTSSPFTLIPSPITTHILYINGRNGRLLETRCSSRSQNFEPSVLNPHAPTCYYVTRWLQSPSDVIANLSTTKNT